MSMPTKKRLVIIETNFAPSTPAAKSLCMALSTVLDAGWDIEVWSSAIQVEDNRVKWRPIPRVSRIGMLQFLLGTVWVTSRYAWRRLRGTIGRETVVLSIGPYMLWSDLFSIHFVSVEYLKQMKAFGGMIKPTPYERIFHGMASVLERILWRMGEGKRAWMVVSERLCKDLRKQVEKNDLFTVLPNSYNRARFNPEVRKLWRNSSREKLGINQDERVFAFVSLGGFERKGLPLALKACSLLNERGIGCRLLVVGGKHSEPPDLSALAAKSGVFDLSFVVAHGRDPRVERLLSAADALLFPSFFEAFSLVEIEAAALGLRLYLTPHYGSEMILREGGNGRLLPWDAAGIADVLEADLRNGSFAQGCSDTGRAVPDEAFGPMFLEQLEAVREWVNRDRRTPSSPGAAASLP